MPRSSDELGQFKTFLASSPAPALIQQLRSMGRAGKEGTTEYNELEVRIQDYINATLDAMERGTVEKDFKDKNIELFDDFGNWIQMEEAVNALSKIK